VVAIPRLGERAALFSTGLDERKRLSFRQSDLRIAPERAELAAHPFGAGKHGVEQRYAVDASIRNAQVARLRIDPIERERFCRGLDA
jgi:hypothetical protein